MNNVFPRKIVERVNNGSVYSVLLFPHIFLICSQKTSQCTLIFLIQSKASPEVPLVFGQNVELELLVLISISLENSIVVECMWVHHSRARKKFRINALCTYFLFL